MNELKPDYIENSQEFILNKHRDGCLFLREKFLDKLPHDWHDAFMFIFAYGLSKKENPDDKLLIVFDDEESEKLCKLAALDRIEVYIVSDRKHDGKDVLWNVWLTKEYIDDDPNPKKLFIGGENLRKFCDERNIFYRSTLTEDNKLLSGSNLMWQKFKDEDCRNPNNDVDDVNKRIE